MKKTLMIAALLATLSATAAQAGVYVRSYSRPVIVQRTVVVHRSPSVMPVLAGVAAGVAIHHALTPRPVIVAPHPVVVAHPVDVCDTLNYNQRVAINAKAGHLVCYQ